MRALDPVEFDVLSGTYNGGDLGDDQYAALRRLVVDGMAYTVKTDTGRLEGERTAAGELALRVHAAYLAAGIP